jgi:predicted RNA-binding Zn-ribbon protein involved in translation (DUF1610 family)
MDQTPPAAGSDAADEETGLRCDFCGAQVARVRRVALDGDYDRLQAPHAVRYACPECSQRKELARLGLARR